MPRCVPAKTLAALVKHKNPDVAACASELIRARKKLAKYREEAKTQPLLVEDDVEEFWDFFS